MTSAENLASLIEARELLAAKERRRTVQFMTIVAALAGDFHGLQRELQADHDDQRNGDWTR